MKEREIEWNLYIVQSNGACNYNMGIRVLKMLGSQVVSRREKTVARERQHGCLAAPQFSKLMTR